MFLKVQQQFALIDCALSIQVQLRDSGASGRSQADDDCKVIAPGKVFVPVVPARMLKRDGFLANRINRVVLLYLWLLHRWQARARFSAMLLPPTESGLMCSVEKASGP